MNQAPDRTRARTRRRRALAWLALGGALLQTAAADKFVCRDLVVRAALNGLFEATTPLLIERVQDELGAGSENAAQP